MRYFRPGLIGLALALVGLCLLAPSPGRSAPGPQSWAVVVGIDDYIRNSITDLKYAGSDAKLFAEALKDVAKFPPNNIFLFTSDTLEESQQPKLTNIIFRLDWLRKNVKPEDTVLFYFAGHGVTVEGEPFLLTEEADNRSLETLKISALRGSDLSKLLSKIPAHNTMMMVDACRNDPSSGRGDTANNLDDNLSRALTFVPDPNIPRQGARPSSAVLFACSVGERSWEWDDKKHGFFTYYLVDGLRKGAGTDANGNVTLQNLVDYVLTNVREGTLRYAAAPQNPTFHYDGPGANTWVLASRGTPGVGYGNAKPDKKQELNTTKYIAELDAVRAKLEAEQASRKAAEERAKLEESKRRELETMAALEQEKRQLLESRMAQLESQVKSNPNPTEVQALKAELDKARAEAQSAQAAAAAAQKSAEEARKARELAEQKVAVAAQSGQESERKAAEAARLAAVAADNKAKAEAAEARLREVAAQNAEMQKRVAMLESSLKESATGNDAKSAAVEAELKKAQAALVQAKQEADAAREQALAAQKAREAAEKSVASASKSGQAAEVEAARRKAAEMAAAEAQKQAQFEAARRAELESAKKELEQKLALLENRLNTQTTTSAAVDENQKLLADQLKLAEQARLLAEARVAATEAKLKESENRYAEFKNQAEQAQLAMRVIEVPDAKTSAELEKARREAEQLRAANAKLEEDKRRASNEARVAQEKVKDMEDELEAKHGGKAFGAWGRTTRRIRLSDFADVLSLPQEAQELPGPK